jgi:hypothetical protein
VIKKTRPGQIEAEMASEGSSLENKIADLLFG